MQNDNHGWEFLAGALLGSGVGVATALLLAPHSGQETRQTIQERSRLVTDRATDIGEKGFKRAEDLSDQAHKGVGQVQARGRVVIVQQGTRLHKAINQGIAAFQKNGDGLMTPLARGNMTFSYLDRFSATAR